ncbi:MAG: DUF6084 family protein [Thiohalocapsa sp.]
MTVDLDFAVDGAEIARNAAAPLLLFKLRVSNRTPSTPVRNVVLQAQIQIAATHRAYSASERERLSELYGSGDDWQRALRPLLWTTAGILLPPFEEGCAVDLPVPCSSDFTLAATKYFFGIEAGEAVLSFLFSGSIFFATPEGDLQIAQVPHHKEASCHLPVGLWQDLMEHHYQDRVWLDIGRASFDALYRYKRQHRLASWDETLHRLLEQRP